MRLISRSKLLVGTLGVAFGLVGVVAQASAQSTFRGKVTSQRGDPLVGATVAIGELQLTSYTNAQGQYVLTVPAARVNGQQITLAARSIGYKSVSRIIPGLTAGERTIDFELPTDINKLEEIVITGVIAGTERANSPFPIGRVTAEDLPVPAQNIVSSLAGRIPGVRVSSPSGQPGASPQILLRGPKSLNNQGRGTGPLYIVDGAMIEGDLPDFNSLDIESIEVVKGAAGASLYGARAGNGVITIKTKGSKSGTDGVRFNFRTEYGFSDIEGDFGSAQSHALTMDETGSRICVNVATSGVPCGRSIDWYSELLRVNNTTTDFASPPPSLNGDGQACSGGAAGCQLRNTFQINRWPGRTYNPVAQAATRNPYLNSNLDMSGRFGSTGFFVSVNRRDQQGALRGLDGTSNSSVRVNVDQRISSNLALEVRTFFNDAKLDNGNPSFFRLTRVPAATSILWTDPQGRRFVRTDLRTSGNQNENPLQLTNQLDDLPSTRFLGSANLKWTPLSWFDLSADAAYDRRNTGRLVLLPKGYRTTQAAPAPGTNGGAIRRDNTNDLAINASVNATLRREIASGLNGTLALRALYDQQDQQFDRQDGASLAVLGVTTSNNAAANQAIQSTFTSSREIGMFAGAVLNYKDRYILDGSVRRDGTSLFGSDNRWANFGRISGVWRVSNEAFWGDDFFINEFKLRASRGSAGGRPRFSAQYETYTIGNGGLLTLGQAGNRGLRPETTVENEIGVDLELFNRIGIEATYAHSVTRDQILPVNVPAALGFTTQWQNAGTLASKSYELAVNIPLINSKDVFWATRFTYDRTRSDITELNVPTFTVSGNTSGSGTIFTMQPGRFGDMYGRRFATECAQLPAAFAADCGSVGKSFVQNDDGWIVWVGQGNNWNEGITKNLYQTQLPAAQSPWYNATTGAGVVLNFGMPIVLRNPTTLAAERQIIGNVFPDFRFSVTQDLTWKRLSVFALLDASIGLDVYNEGKGWALLDFQSSLGDQTGKTVENAKPTGYWWRVNAPENSAGLGGFYDVLNANSWAVEDASFAKLREVQVSYKLGPIAKVGDWTVGVIGRNLATITNYTGFDPETGVNGGFTNSGLINGIDSFTFPNTRTISFQVSTRF